MAPCTNAAPQKVVFRVRRYYKEKIPFLVGHPKCECDPSAKFYQGSILPGRRWVSFSLGGVTWGEDYLDDFCMIFHAVVGVIVVGKVMNVFRQRLSVWWFEMNCLE